MYMPSGLKNKMVNEAYHHHHQSQNRPHQKTITHAQGPPEPAIPYDKFFGRGESLIGPPLPHLNYKNVLVIELLLYNRHYQNQGTAKDKQI